MWVLVDYDREQMAGCDRGRQKVEEIHQGGVVTSTTFNYFLRCPQRSLPSGSTPSSQMLSIRITNDLWLLNLIL